MTGNAEKSMHYKRVSLPLRAQFAVKGVIKSGGKSFSDEAQLLAVLSPNATFRSSRRQNFRHF
jgi:hypothetical protein